MIISKLFYNMEYSVIVFNKMSIYWFLYCIGILELDLIDWILLSNIFMIFNMELI